MTAQLCIQAKTRMSPDDASLGRLVDVEIRNIGTEVQYLPSWAMFPKFEIPDSAHAPGASNLGGRLLDTN